MLKPASIPIVDPKSLLESVPGYDLHLHTQFTDGQPTIAQYVDRAIELGLEHIGFPEHCNLKTTWLRDFVPALEEQRKRVAGRLRVHWGIEAKGMNRQGALAAKPEMMEAAEYVYGAFHSSLTDTPFPSLEKEAAIEMEFEVTLAMIRARSCHAIAHPGGLSRKYQGSFPNELFDELARHAGACEVALELNPGYGGDLRYQVEVCVKHDCRVVLGSNAHELGELGVVVNELRASMERAR
jgi:putative hydrolase